MQPVAYRARACFCREEDCAMCGQWTAADREVLRNGIIGIPLGEPFCEACLAAFWHNCIVGLEPPRREPTEPTQH